MKKNIFIIILSLSLILITVASLFADEVNGELYDINGKNILKIWGTHSERGYAYGFLMQAGITDVMKNYILGQVFMNNSIAYENIRTYFENYYGIEQKYIDETESMITGIQEGGGILYSTVLGRDLDYIDILLCNTIVDLSARFSILGDVMHCSGISSWGESTVQDPELAGESIITRLLDWTPSQTLLDNQLIIVSIPSEADEQGWISFSFSGMLGSLSGINESGVTAFMDVGNNSNHPNMETLHPIFLSIRNGIESADYNGNGQCNPDDVAAAIEDKLHLSGSITHSICSTEKDSFAIVIECNNASGVAIRNVENNTVVPGDNLVATNHFRELYPPVYCYRYNNIVDSLDANTEISSERSWNLLCGAAGTYGNIQTIQFIPFNGEILWATSPNPANPAYTQIPAEFDLQELFDLNNVTPPIVENNLQIYAHPNPFSKNVEISYKLPENIRSSQIEIFNIKGQLVAKFRIENSESEINKIVWDASGYSAGIYFYKFNIEKSPIGKMVLMR
ncbi:MAG: T9SS type A sorting domain-containing protein [Candidatus Cloacimonadota bacterium]|nr:T9SS type A sorting domain-containing protein [Candidatus Cloacimonadota bacterium]